MWELREIQRGRRKIRKRNFTLQGTWPVPARTNSLWLFYVRTLGKRQKIEASNSLRRLMPTPWENRTVGKVRRGGRRTSHRTEERID